MRRGHVPLLSLGSSLFAMSQLSLLMLGYFLKMCFSILNAILDLIRQCNG